MPRRTPAPSTDAAGVALIEALIAIALLASALIALAGLLATAASATHRANVVSTAAVLASRKMEQLRALAWSTDTAGAAISDTSTDTSAIDQAPSCRVQSSSSGTGTGLSVSPPAVLDVDTAGYVDYVDGLGCGLGGGTRPPSGSVYVRRWSVTSLPSSVDAAVVLQVVVARYGPVTAGQQLIRGRPSSARLVSVKSRKRP